MFTPMPLQPPFRSETLPRTPPHPPLRRLNNLNPRSALARRREARLPVPTHPQLHRPVSLEVPLNRLRGVPAGSAGSLGLELKHRAGLPGVLQSPLRLGSGARPRPLNLQRQRPRPRLRTSLEEPVRLLLPVDSSDPARQVVDCSVPLNLQRTLHPVLLRRVSLAPNLPNPTRPLNRTRACSVVLPRPVSLARLLPLPLPRLQLRPTQLLRRLEDFSEERVGNEVPRTMGTLKDRKLVRPLPAVDCSEASAEQREGLVVRRHSKHRKRTLRLPLPLQ